jgi:hypothetical protein
VYASFKLAREFQMDNRVFRPLRLRCLQVVAAALLAACGGGGGGDAPPLVSGIESFLQAAPVSSCDLSQAQVLVDEIRIGQVGARDLIVTLPEPRPVDLLDPGTGVLEALQIAPLTRDATEVRLRTARGSTVRLSDGTVAPLRVPGNLRLTGDFRLAAGMVADLVVLGFDRCNAIRAAGNSGQFVLNGDVLAQVRALPFVTDREQPVGGMLRPLPGEGFATVSSPPGVNNSFTIQRFDAYGGQQGGPINISLPENASAQVTPLVNGVVLATWLGPTVDPDKPLAQRFPLMVQRFGADGTPQGAPVQVALAQPFNSRINPPDLPQAAALADGGAALVWLLSDANGPNIYLQRFAADGSTAGGPQRVNITSRGGLPNVVGLTGGRVLVAWGLGSLFARVFEADGAGGAEQAIAPDAVSIFGPPQLAALADGGAAVAWTTQMLRFEFIEEVRLAPDGAPLTSPLVFSDGSSPSVAGLADGGFVVAFPPGNGIVAADRFGADGIRDGPGTRVNVSNDIAVPPVTAVALPWGGFLIGWHDRDTGQDMLRFFDAQALLGPCAGAGCP